MIAQDTLEGKVGTYILDLRSGGHQRGSVSDPMKEHQENIQKIKILWEGQKLPVVKTSFRKWQELLQMESVCSGYSVSSTDSYKSTRDVELWKDQ